MNLSAIVSLSRLRNIIRMRAALYGKRSLLAFGALFIIYCVVIFSNYNHRGGVSSFTGTFLFLVGTGGLVMAGSAFSSFRDKLKTSEYLLFPGSISEKFIIELLARIILPWLILPLLYLLCSRVVTGYLTWANPDQTIELFSFDYLWNSFGSMPSDVKYLFICIYVFVQSIFFSGSAIFQKQPPVKTLLFVGGIAAVIFYAFYLRFEVLHLRHKPWILDALTEDTLLKSAYFFVAFSIISVWSYTFCKLNEKQIV